MNIKKLYEKYVTKEKISPIDGNNYKIIAGSDEARARRAGSPGRKRLNQLSKEMHGKIFSQLNYSQKDEVMAKMDEMMNDIPLEEDFEPMINDKIKKLLSNFKAGTGLGGYLEIMDENLLWGEMTVSSELEEEYDIQDIMAIFFDKAEKILRRNNILIDIDANPRVINRRLSPISEGEYVIYEVESNFKFM